jgi:streptogramin lyase
VGTVLDSKGYLSDGVNFPDGVSVGDGYIWVANASGDGLRIDPVTHSKKRFSVKGGFVAPFAVYAGGVWHLGSNGLSRLDTSTLQERSFGYRSLSIIAATLDEASGTLWVASYKNTITRIDLGAS